MGVDSVLWKACTRQAVATLCLFCVPLSFLLSFAAVPSSRPSPTTVRKKHARLRSCKKRGTYRIGAIGALKQSKEVLGDSEVTVSRVNE